MKKKCKVVMLPTEKAQLNTVIISQAKTMYSRDEVIKLIEDAHDIGYENCQYDKSLTVTARQVDIDKWIEENL